MKFTIEDSDVADLLCILLEDSRVDYTAEVKYLIKQDRENGSSYSNAVTEITVDNYWLKKSQQHKHGLSLPGRCSIGD